LDRADAAIVRRAAVLGVSFDPRRLADVLAPDMAVPDDRFWERLSPVFSKGRDGFVRFRRPALQEVAYASLPFKLRRELHEAIGLRLERAQGSDLDAGPAVLSNHFALARDYVRTGGHAPSERPSGSPTPTPRACTGARSTQAGPGARPTRMRWPRPGSRWARRFVQSESPQRPAGP